MSDSPDMPSDKVERAIREHSAEWNLQTSTILVIDDQINSLGAVLEFLADNGFDILVAEDGESGLERARYAQPDLILLDVRMPGLDGFETCRRLKADESTHKMPVIFMTLLTETEDKITGFEVGGVDYITKPFQVEELLARLKTHLAVRWLQQQLTAQNTQLQQEIAERQRVEEELHKYRERLEEQVATRTAELSQANVQLQYDITERKQLEKRLEAIYQLGRELTLLYDEATIMQRVLNTVADVLQFEMVGSGFVDKEADELEYRYYLLSGFLKKIRLRLPLTGSKARSMGAAVVRSGQALGIADTNHDTHYIPFLADWPTRSGICVPMKTGQQVIGVLNVESLEPNYFTPADQQLLQALADQAAVALENAYLFKAEQRQREIATILAEVVASVSLNLSKDELLDQILLKLGQLLAYDSASIFLIEGGQLVIEAMHGFESDITIEPQTIGQNVLFQEMLSQRNYIFIQDTHTDSRYRHWQGTEKIRAWVGAPLVVAQDVIGYLSVDRHLPGAFTIGDANLIQAFAHQVAQTIYNTRLFADLMETRAQLIQRERLAALGQMAATMAHEMRNPLMAIRAGVEYLLYDVSEDDPRWEGATLMRSSIERIDRIVEGILFISQTPQPALGPSLLRPVIENEMARWSLTLTEKGINCHLQLADNLPLILLDPDQIGRALSNLISNSVDVLPPDGELHLTLTLADKGQIITLADTGPGISPEHLPQIFEPFFTTKLRGSGGLGLAIVKQIIDYHQGDITVWSEVGVGTRFTITLPMK